MKCGAAELQQLGNSCGYFLNAQLTARPSEATVKRGPAKRVGAYFLQSSFLIILAFGS
jgi:hypothetical protein